MEWGGGGFLERALLNAAAHLCPRCRRAYGDTLTFPTMLKCFTLVILLLARCTKAVAFSIWGCLGGESVIAKPFAEGIQEKVEWAPGGTAASHPGDSRRAPRGAGGGAQGGKAAYIIANARTAVS